MKEYIFIYPKNKKGMVYLACLVCFCSRKGFLVESGGWGIVPVNGLRLFLIPVMCFLLSTPRR